MVERERLGTKCIIRNGRIRDFGEKVRLAIQNQNLDDWDHLSEAGSQQGYVESR